MNQTQNLGEPGHLGVVDRRRTPTFSDATTGASAPRSTATTCRSSNAGATPIRRPAHRRDPGPSPSQCEFGGESNTPTSTSYPIAARRRLRVLARLSQPSWSNSAQVTPATPTAGSTRRPGSCIEPFDAVDGTVVDQQANYNYRRQSARPAAVLAEPVFQLRHTNEVDFARTYADGTGEQLFQVDTGLEAPGLGCGQGVQTGRPAADQGPTAGSSSCPAAPPAEENPTGLTGVTSVVTSPLNPVAWANRIAIPLSSSRSATSCAIGGNEERIVGSELATTAVSSWQPALCASPGAPPTTTRTCPTTRPARTSWPTELRRGRHGCVLRSHQRQPDRPVESGRLRAPHPVGRGRRLQHRAISRSGGAHGSSRTRRP